MVLSVIRIPLFSKEVSALLVQASVLILAPFRIHGPSLTSRIGWSAFVDLTLAVYPAFFLYKIRLQPIVKFGLCLLMSLGVV
jgi:hypothetical protein